MRAINKDKIIEAYIREPYVHVKFSIGWGVILIVGYSQENQPITILVEKNSQQECIEFLESLSLTII